MLTFNGNPQLKQELLNRLDQVAGQFKDRDLQVDRPHWSKLLGLNRLEYKTELCADRLGVPLSLMIHETYIYRQMDTAAEARQWVESFINALPVNARINERAIVISMVLACIEHPEHGLLCLEAAQKAREPLMKVAELIRSDCTIAKEWQSAIKMLGQCVHTIACPKHLTSSDWLQAMVLNVTIEAATSLANYFLHDHQHGFASGLAFARFARDYQSQADFVSVSSNANLADTSSGILKSSHRMHMVFGAAAHGHTANNACLNAGAEANYKLLLWQTKQMLVHLKQTVVAN